MRAVIQRVNNCSVTIDGKEKSKIGKGLAILVGVEDMDTEEDIEWLTSKITHLRIFNDENGIMNRSVVDVSGELIAISQFTLMAQTKKGNRPSYIKASKPEFSKPMYEKFCIALEKASGTEVHTGVFGADMKVTLENDGPVTIIIDTKNKE